MSKGFEERYLMILLSAVMNQKAPPEGLRQLDWEKMYRLSDYHHVAHAIYYGIMGINEEIPKSVRKRFFEKYLEAVHRKERLGNGEASVRAILEKRKIPCFIPSFHEMVKCYPVEEMCCRDSIEIGTDKKYQSVIREILENADFEERQTEENGHLYYRVPGIKVFSYHRTLFFSRPMRKFYKRLLAGSPRAQGCKYIRVLSPDDEYLFLMCRLTDSYARGEISLSQIADFWAFYKKYGETFNWPYIYEKLRKLKIAEFAEKLEYLVLRWFGSGVGIEDAEVYDAMESYILTKGAEGREISSKYLPLIQTVADCYERNRKAENIKKIMKWLFPDKRYMESIYPLLGKLQFMLPIFWLHRLSRYGLRLMIHSLKEKANKLIAGIPFLRLLHAKKKDTESEPEESRDQIQEDEEDKSADIPR